MKRRREKEESTILLRFGIQMTERVEVGADRDAEFHTDGDG